MDTITSNNQHTAVEETAKKKDVQKESQKQPKPFETNGMKVDFYDILRNIIILFTYTFEPNSLLTLKVSIL